MENHSSLSRQVTASPVDRIICGVCYISLPLIALVLLTIAFSLLRTGRINTDVNSTTGFFDVILNFSLPMVLSLVIGPLTVKHFAQKTSLTDVGFNLPASPLSRGFCIFMGILTVVATIYLQLHIEAKISACTILIHFFFVALSEETILRGVVMHELSGVLKNRLALCLINGTIFAFVYHSNDDFLTNLLVRFPLGIVLSYVRLKSDSLYPAIMLHLMHNMLVTVI